MSVSVESAVLLASDHHQILRSVILPVAIDVMDDLVRTQSASEQTFHDKPGTFEVATATGVALSRADIGEHITLQVNLLSLAGFIHERAVARETSICSRAHGPSAFGALSQMLQVERVAVRFGARFASEITSVARAAQARARLLGLATVRALRTCDMVLPPVSDGIPGVATDTDRARHQLRSTALAGVVRVLATAAANFLHKRASRAAALRAGMKFHALSLLQIRHEVYLGG